MKKSLILALSMTAAPLFAGEPAPVTVVTPPPPAPSPLGVEIAGVYGSAMGCIYDGGVSKDIDVMGADVTITYALTENHSVNLRLGYTFGDECMHSPESYDLGGGVYESGGMRWETDIHTFTIMPGYRYTHAVDKKLSVYAGVNVGVANVSVKDWLGGAFGWTDGVDKLVWGARERDHDSAWGFAYSLEIGANYKLNDNWSVFATWGIFGNTAEPEPWSYYGGAAIDQQWYHGVRLGVGYKF